ncbi:hypothetical protein [Actinacidiphila oryziradicis]|uniref:Uncharacterized protein n=1 Tax=Actinacidiphila oryziradicis TaxID=2571141 RepID=A0A4U0RZV3_9ACTN|nr:hypothetical protein [Actinacidiphila oryziradicis]TKA01984.1 hypothetical protein FCI23_39630 [Actinacidiphila oryziradicis]
MKQWINPRYTKALAALRRVQVSALPSSKTPECPNANCEGRGAIVVIDSNGTPFTVPCAACGSPEEG